MHTAETLLPWKEYCHDLNHSEMVHISRAKMVCKMNIPKLFMLFLQIHETPYLSFTTLSSKKNHEEMEQGDNEVMEGMDKKIKT